jgi:ABC-type transporter Mla MlaB component
MSEVFFITHETGDLSDTFLLRGMIDIHAGARLAALPEQVTGSKVRFDFSEVGRINSGGIAHLLRCFKKIRDGGTAEITLTGLSTFHTMLFKTTGVFLLARAESAGQ